MRVDLKMHISEELATIFRAEFDHDSSVDDWLSHIISDTTHAEWVAANEALNAFIEGLRNCQLILECDNGRLLGHPYCYLHTFTKIDDDDESYIDILAEDYLPPQSNIDNVRVALRKECLTIFAQLDAIFDAFYEPGYADD